MAATAALVSVALLVGAGLALLISSPAVELARAVERTLGTGSARLAVTASVVDVPVLGEVDLTVADGVVDFETPAAQIEREVPFLADLAPLPGIDRIASVELRYVADGVWLATPVDVGGRWVRLDRDAAEGQEDAGEGALALSNPLAVIALLRAIDTERVGDVDERGGRTRYAVEIDLDVLAEQLGGDGGRLLAGLRRSHPDGLLPLEVAVDGDGRIDELSMTTPVDLARLGQLTVNSTVRFSEFGLPVDLQAPDADDVVDVDPGALNPFDWLADLLDRIPGR